MSKEGSRRKEVSDEMSAEIAGVKVVPDSTKKLVQQASRYRVTRQVEVEDRENPGQTKLVWQGDARFGRMMESPSEIRRKQGQAYREAKALLKANRPEKSRRRRRKEEVDRLSPEPGRYGR